MMLTRTRHGALGCVLGASLAAPAATQESDSWSFSLSPYAWFVSLDGASRPIGGLPSADVDADFGDLIENTNFAFLAVAEARTDRWGVTADLIYMNLTAEGNTPGPLFSGVEADLESFIGTFAGNYRVARTEDYWVDLLAGARVWSVDTDITAKAGILPEISGGDSETWVDPIIGARGSVDLGRGFGLRGYADIGGFGASSDLTWQLYGGVGYSFNRRVAAEAGYRYLSVDYEEDGFLYDIDFHGPTIGARIRF